MKTTRVVTPVFCNAKLLELFLEQYYEYQKGNYEHWLLDNHYPIGRNKDKIYELANKYHCKVLDCEKDTSLQGSTNLLLEHLNWPSGWLLSVDADSAFEQMSHGFDVAMTEVMDAGEKYNIGLLALWGIGIDLKWRERQDFSKKFIASKLFGISVSGKSPK